MTDGIVSPGWVTFNRRVRAGPKRPTVSHRRFDSSARIQLRFRSLVGEFRSQNGRYCCKTIATDELAMVHAPMMTVQTARLVLLSLRIFSR